MKNMMKNRLGRRTMISFVLAALLFSLAACTSGGQKAENKTEKKYQDIIDGYLKDLPAVQAGTAESTENQEKLLAEMVLLYNRNTSSKEVYAFYKDGITKLSPEKGDKFTYYAIAALNRNCANDYTEVEKYSSDAGFIEKFKEELKSVDSKYVKLNRNIEGIKDAKVKELVQGAKDQGYYLTMSEGMLYYEVDFTEFAKYRNCNTKAMASLLRVLAIESLQPLASDAAFIVSADVLAARTYEIEKLLSDYKGTQFEKYLAVKYKDYMTMVFFGVNNTPNFSYETNKMNENTKALFTDIQNLDSTFMMSKLVTEFKNTLDKNSDTLDETTREKAKGILKAIDDKYGLTDFNVEEYRQWMMGYLIKFN